ncbi:MAG: hypothetical protein ABJA34_06160 [Pseudonocardiales bacterium]
MTITLAAARVPDCAPASRQASTLAGVSGATPFDLSAQGTGVSRVRMTIVKTGDDTAQGTAARGKPV